MVKVLQLTVEVGNCRLPPSLPNTHSYILSVELSTYNLMQPRN